MNSYPLEALDQVINSIVNPEDGEIHSLSGYEVRILEKTINEEKEKLRNMLMAQAFKLTKESKVQTLILQYHSTLISLLQQVYLNREYFPEEVPHLRQAFHVLTRVLDELLGFIEMRFSAYINLSATVPLTYLAVSKAELKLRLDTLRPQFVSIVGDQEYSDLVLNEINHWLDSTEESSETKYHTMLYMRDLISELEYLSIPEIPRSIFAPLTELLVCFNFNTRAFIAYLSKFLHGQIHNNIGATEKLAQLQFIRKEFSGLPHKRGVVYNPAYFSVKSEIERWFNHEYLKIAETAAELPAVIEKPKVSKEKPDKLLLTLTGDQIGLLLRALDQNKVIIAGSTTAIFRKIVPHLSTTEKDDLSPENTRTKSYNASDNDKDIVVKMLEKLIRSVREL